MQKSDVACECGAVYTRLEVEQMHDQPQVHQFQCGACGRTLEAGVTKSIIGYRMVVQHGGPFVDSPADHSPKG